MNFSKTTEYALRVMRFMAMDEKRLYSSSEVFKSLTIPFRYLRKLLILLSKNGLLVSVQGKHGGYRIAKNLVDISLLDIIQTVGDDQVINKCFFGFESCAFEKKCAIHDKWAAVREHINDVLSSTTLAELKESGPQSFISNNN